MLSRAKPRIATLPPYITPRKNIRIGEFVTILHRTISYDLLWFLINSYDSYSLQPYIPYYFLLYPAPECKT